MSISTSKRAKIRVGVLRGGPSSEYDVSLKTGANILKNISENYIPIDIFISRDGEWHIGGRVKTPDKIVPHIDVVFNALHGAYGEDGKVQNLLQTFNIPFTGTKSFASAMGMNKYFSKALFEYHGIKTPQYVVVHSNDNSLSSLIKIFRSFPQPSIIKPTSGGSSLGITFARDFDSFKEGIQSALKHSGSAIVEEYIDGTEVTCGVLGSTDGVTSFSLVPVSPAKHQKDFFDYDLKYENNSEHICPSPISKEEAESVQKIALDIHKQFGLRHYSAVDFILHPTRGLFLIEVNTLPGLTPTSLFPKTLETHGITMSEFIDHVLEMTLNPARL